MAALPSHMWFVRTGAGVFGPYAEQRLLGFVAEGRIGPTTALSPFADGPWEAAAATAEFADLFVDPQPVPPAKPSPMPAASMAEWRQPDPRMPDRRGPDRRRSDRRDPQGRNSSPAPRPTGPTETAAGGPIPASGSLRALIVFAELTSVTAPAFHAALLAYGPCMVVRPGLWLVLARTGAAGLRNPLSRRLGANDILFVIEAAAEHAAWFNLDPETDRELRRLWNMAGAA